MIKENRDRSFQDKKVWSIFAQNLISSSATARNPFSSFFFMFRQVQQTRFLIETFSFISTMSEDRHWRSELSWFHRTTDLPKANEYCRERLLWEHLNVKEDHHPNSHHLWMHLRHARWAIVFSLIFFLHFFFIEIRLFIYFKTKTKSRSLTSRWRRGKDFVFMVPASFSMVAASVKWKGAKQHFF